MSKSKTAIVIPTYNEKGNIGLLLDSIFSSLPHARVVVIDDDSPDGTIQIVKQKQKQFSQLDLLVRKKQRGRGGACIEGFKHVLCKYKDVAYIVEMDADLSQDVSEIPKLLVKADKETIVVGSRYVKGSKILDWPLWRLVLSKIANFYIKLVLRVPINDYTSGFRCYSRKVLKSLDFSSIKHKGFITLSETAYKLHQKGFKFKEVPYTLKDRTRGKSNATWREILVSMIAIWQIRCE